MSYGEITIPGAVDIHTHLREPGTNLAETYDSGTAAAMYGGYVVVNDMPNTPGRPTWTTERIYEKAGLIVYHANLPMALYAGSQPDSDNIGELAGMAKYAIDLKLYGSATTGNHTEYEAVDFRDNVTQWDKIAPDLPIMFHAGPNNLEDMIGLVAQDLGHQLHVCHVSDMEQIELVNAAKRKGLPVTAGVTPHHLFLNSQDANRMGWYGRMQPPLAHQTDSERLFAALVAGEIDIVETDHAPHLRSDKNLAEERNPHAHQGEEHKTCYGVPNIEFALPLLLRQMRLGRITLERLVEVTSTKPADIIGIKIGEDTKVTWDLEEFRIEDELNQVKSKAGYTPFLGSLAVGRVKHMSIGGVERTRNGRRVKHNSQRGWLVHQRGETV